MKNFGFRYSISVSLCRSFVIVQTLPQVKTEVHQMKAVISVIGKDKVGILASVSTQCAKYGVNIIEVTQSVMQNMFCMIMLGDIDGITVSFAEFSEKLDEMGKEMNVSVHCMHEDIFNSMHRI